MAIDQRKRQKKLNKKKNKRKKAVAAAKKEMEKVSYTMSEVGQLNRAVKAPVHECLVSNSIFERGMGSVIISRRLLSDNIAAAVFLVDAYCLGVKNAFFKVMSRSEYQFLIDEVSGNEALQNMDPACARKLVEGAEAFAKNIGFRPHPDYELAKKFWGDIDSNNCSKNFVYGKDGKPFFIAGPYDIPIKIQKVIKTLTNSCGEDGFEYLLPMGEFEEDDFEELYFEEDEEDEDEDEDEDEKERL